MVFQSQKLEDLLKGKVKWSNISSPPIWEHALGAPLCQQKQNFEKSLIILQNRYSSLAIKFPAAETNLLRMEQKQKIRKRNFKVTFNQQRHLALETELQPSHPLEKRNIFFFVIINIYEITRRSLPESRDIGHIPACLVLSTMCRPLSNEGTA